jgi:hypothetical protein
MKTYTMMICLSCAASAFEAPRTGVVPRNSHSHSQLFAGAANGRGPGRPRKKESLDYDPYGGFLDVDTVMPTTGSVADALLKEWSLEEETGPPSVLSPPCSMRHPHPLRVPG